MPSPPQGLLEYLLAASSSAIPSTSRGISEHKVRDHYLGNNRSVYYDNKLTCKIGVSEILEELALMLACRNMS